MSILRAASRFVHRHPLDALTAVTVAFLAMTIYLLENHA